MIFLRRVGRFLVNPFILATLLLFGLYVVAQFFSIIPGPYRVPDDAPLEMQFLAAMNRIAAFEINTAALLLSIVAVLGYTLFIHSARTVHEAAAKQAIALLLFLQTIEFGNRVFCKMAQDSIVASHGGWVDIDAKELCARTIGDWPIKIQIAAAIIGMGFIAWTYLAQTRFGSWVSGFLRGLR